MERREFLEKALLSVFSGVAITITSACGRQNAAAPKPSTTNSGNSGESETSASDPVSGAVSANHGHSAVVTSAMMTAGAGVSLNITGGSDHAHLVNLTAEQVEAIKEGTRVSVLSSSGGGHTHQVTFH